MKHTTEIKIALGIAAMVFVACNGPEKQLENRKADIYGQPHMVGVGPFKGTVYYPQDQLAANNSSVSVKNGKYNVDSAIILSDINKRSLVAQLQRENLEEINTVAEIPGFIKTFLDSISGNGKFDMVNPGEAWQEDWLTLGKCLPTRQLVYFGTGKNTALFSFYSAGPQKTQCVAIIKFENEQVIDFWFEANSIPVTKKAELIEYLKRNKNKNGNC